MIYLLLIVSLFEKWSLKYHFSLPFSYDLLLTLSIIVFVIISTVIYDSSLLYKISLLIISILTISCFIFSNSSLYSFIINNIVVLGNIAIAYYTFKQRNNFNAKLFLNVNYFYISLSLILYLISKYIYFNDDILLYINNGHGYKYPFYSSGSFTLTFSEPSFAGTYLVAIYIATITVFSKKQNVLFASMAFFFFVYLSGSKISLTILTILIFFKILNFIFNMRYILKFSLIYYIPATLIISMAISFWTIHPSFIEFLPEGSRDSFYTRFFFIFNRFSYIFDTPLGFVFNFDNPVIFKTINTFTSISNTKEYSLELLSFIQNSLYFVPKDYFSLLMLNFGLFSIIILSIFSFFIFYLINKLNICFNSQLILLTILLFISFSNNLTSISILVLLPIFLRSETKCNAR